MIQCLVLILGIHWCINSGMSDHYGRDKKKVPRDTFQRSQYNLVRTQKMLEKMLFSEHQICTQENNPAQMYTQSCWVKRNPLN